MDFQVGDTVRIKENISDCEIFVSSMDLYRGQEAIITDLCDSYCSIDVDNGLFCWSVDMFEKANNTSMVDVKQEELFSILYV